MFRIVDRDAGDASHAARIVIIALNSMLMIMTTLVADMVLVDGEDSVADHFGNMLW